MGLYEIAHVLNSAERADERVVRVLELLRGVVPSDQCALLVAWLGREPHVVAVPQVSPDERAQLTRTLLDLFGSLVDVRAGASDAPAAPGARQLAVPLVGLDDVIGMLLVRRGAGEYVAADVRLLSVVAAQLTAYFIMLRARAEAAEQRRELDEARRAAEAANRTKDEFLALVSHELKAPLGSILAWAHILGTTAEAAERGRAVAALERDVQQQTRLIDDILELACVATAAVRLKLRVVEPARLIRDTIEGLRLEAERRSIRLDADLDHAAMLLVLDAEWIGEAISSLIANALAFTPAGGHVEVRLERAGGTVRIHVRDSGAGISREALPYVFEAGADARAKGRLGVRLAIVKNVVELHGGRVRAQSAGPEQGATFTIELPCRGVVSSSPPRAAGTGILGGVRVLLVDHDPGICDAFRSVLDCYGAEVTAVSSAPEALAALERARPDVLLFGDLAMPRASVYELMREMAVRAQPLPAASITAYYRVEEAESARAAGFRMHLAKPLEIDSLVGAVARLAGRLGEDGVAKLD